MGRYSNKNDLFAIELDPNLQAILREKGYKIIGENFLSCHYPHSFDLIVMNPPFDNGAKHLLKAWETLHDGEIVCLLNESTYNNQCTQERELLGRIIDENGEVENLGQCFKDAERKTGVEVIMVRLKKEAPEMYDLGDNYEKESFSFSDMHQDSTSLEVADKLQAMERRYLAAIEAYKEMERATSKFHKIAAPLRSSHDFKMKDIGSFNSFIEAFNKSAWNKLLTDTKLRRLMTNKVRNSFEEKFKHQHNLAFTKVNMLKLYDNLMQNVGTILSDCILEAFDYFTKYHEENRCHIEGWKTNDAFKVNRKIILGNCVRYGEYMSSHDLERCGGDKFNMNYSRRTQLEDVDRALCHLTGESMQTTKEKKGIVTIYDALESHFDLLGKVGKGSFGNKCESHFFKIKFFKKGTIHLEFKNKQVWQFFNEKACELRGFPLPSATAKSKREQEKKEKKAKKKAQNTKKGQTGKSLVVANGSNSLVNSKRFLLVQYEGEEYRVLSLTKKIAHIVKSDLAVFVDEFGIYRPAANSTTEEIGKKVDSSLISKSTKKTKDKGDKDQLMLAM
jgi:hypothetical protein